MAKKQIKQQDPEAPRRLTISILVSEELTEGMTANEIYYQVVSTFENRIDKLRKKYEGETIVVSKRVTTVNRSYDTVREFIYANEEFVAIEPTPSNNPNNKDNETE